MDGILKFVMWLTALSLASTAQAEVFAGRYDQVVQSLKGIQSQYPSTSTLISLGVSDSGEEVLGLQIGSGPLENLVVGTHHGNEYGSTAVAVAVAANLAANPIAGQTVYVMPVLNIWGYNRNERRESYGNKTQDPNRDYPGPCTQRQPFVLKSTHSLANFLGSHSIVTSITLHTFAPAVLYPWGISTHDTHTPYDSEFEFLGHLGNVSSGYPVGNSTELLYPADGTFEDFAFWNHGIWSLLFEMGQTHSPNAKQLEELVTQNVPGIRAILEHSPASPAADHEFRGKCDLSLRQLDLFNE